MVHIDENTPDEDLVKLGRRVESISSNELMRRLKNELQATATATSAHNRTMTKLTKVLVWLTVALVVLTVALVVLTARLT